MNVRIALFLTIFLIIGFISCSRKNIQKDYFTVNKVISGNKLLLLNGYTVTLIGIKDNEGSNAYLQNSMPGSKVKFVFDSKSPFKRLNTRNKDKTFYAYVLNRKKECINSKILAENIGDIEFHPYLNDSLAQFEKYARVNKDNKDDDENYQNDGENQYVNNDEDNFNAERYLSNGIKSEFEKLKIACDYLNPITRDFAVKQAGKSSGNYNINQVINIYDAIRPPNWHYVNDPDGYNYISKASNTISRTNLSGDCDDFAVLIYSLIMSIGGEARITFAWDDRSGHAFTEVNLNNFNINEVTRTIRNKFYDFEIPRLFMRTDIYGSWLNLDWWAAYPGGNYFNFNRSVIFYPDKNRYDFSQ